MKACIAPVEVCTVEWTWRSLQQQLHNTLPRPCQLPHNAAACMDQLPGQQASACLCGAPSPSLTALQLPQSYYERLHTEASGTEDPPPAAPRPVMPRAGLRHPAAGKRALGSKVAAARKAAAEGKPAGVVQSEKVSGGS